MGKHRLPPPPRRRRVGPIIAGVAVAGVAASGVAADDTQANTIAHTTTLPSTDEIPAQTRQPVSLASAAERLGQIAASRSARESAEAGAAAVQSAADESAQAATASASAAQAAHDAPAPATPTESTPRPSRAAQDISVTAAATSEPDPPTPAASAPGSAAEVAVSFAMAQLGEPYVWGATGPSSWDCSGLVQAAYAAAGISLPRVSAAQALSGVPVSRANLQPGDLVAFYSPVSHIGIYIGGGRVVHAPESGDVVKVTSIDAFGLIAAMRRVA